MKFVPKILLVAVLLTAYSCKRFPNPFAEHNTILAEVENKKLYLHDVSPIFTPNMTSEDSLKILRSYVDQWVKKQLKIKEAERMLEESQKDIDQMVQEYRNSLLTHKVDQFYVDKNIDTLFTDTQIADYYNQNKADFILDKTLVKARIVRIPRSYDKKKTIEELMLTPARGWLSGSARPVRQKQFRTDRTEPMDGLRGAAVVAAGRQDSGLRLPTQHGESQ